MEGVLRSLTALSSHEKLLHPSPVTSYCEDLRTSWEGLCQEVGVACHMISWHCVCQIKVDIEYKQTVILISLLYITSYNAKGNVQTIVIILILRKLNK